MTVVKYTVMHQCKKTPTPFRQYRACFRTLMTKAQMQENHSPFKQYRACFGTLMTNASTQETHLLLALYTVQYIQQAIGIFGEDVPDGVLHVAILVHLLLQQHKPHHVPAQNMFIEHVK